MAEIISRQERDKIKVSSSNLVGFNILKFDNNFNVKKVSLIVSILSKMQLM